MSVSVGRVALRGPRADNHLVRLQPVSADEDFAQVLLDSEQPGPASVQKALMILELVASRQGMTAREIASALSLPLPTVYRLLSALTAADYLVHLRSERRYELGYKLHQLGLSLHRQVGVPSQVRGLVAQLHTRADAAAYFSVYRGSEVVLAYVVDSPARPRIKPMTFGFHEAAHATAFGKILLAGMTVEQRDEYLTAHEIAPLTAHTVADRATLETELAEVGRIGIAWDREEFMLGATCAAVAVHGPSGMVLGSMAISAPADDVAQRAASIEAELRGCAADVSRYLRGVK